MHIDHIAKLAGVSTATVSRVLNGSDLVRPETAARVRKIIADVGYVPNQSARTLSSGQSRIFAAIIGQVTNPWVAELLHAFEIECASHSYDAIFSGTDMDDNRTTAALQRMIERQVDGIAIFASHIDPQSAALLLRHKIPVCGLAYGPTEGVYHALRINYTPGIDQAIQHLKKLGHKDIAFISGPFSEYTARDRVDKFRIAMSAAGLWVFPELIRESGWRVQDGMHAAQKLLDEKRHFTAILCSNDAMAFGALRALRGAGRQVPGDVSVIGIDNLESAEISEPPLTTIHIPLREIAQLAFNSLYGASQKGEAQPRESVVNTSLVVRESTAIAKKQTNAKR